MRAWAFGRRLVATSDAGRASRRAGRGGRATHVEPLEGRALMSASFELVQDPTAAGSPGRARADILVASRSGGQSNIEAGSTDGSTSTTTTGTQTSELGSTFNINIVAGSGL